MTPGEALVILLVAAAVLAEGLLYFAVDVVERIRKRRRDAMRRAALAHSLARAHRVPGQERYA